MLQRQSKCLGMRRYSGSLPPPIVDMTSYGMLSNLGHCSILWLGLVLCLPTLSHASADNERTDFQFALLRYNGGNWNPRENGLPRLAWEIRKRTSIGVDLETIPVDPSSDSVFEFPLIVWQGDKSFPPLPEHAIHNLRQHLTMGGTLVVDVSDGLPDGPFHSSVERELRRIFPEKRVSRVNIDHVLYKAFYLLDRHGGRISSRSYLTGLHIEDRLAVIITTNDMAGAIARDEFGEWEYDVDAGGETTREMTFRLGINLVMYTLCLDYKEDQVHIPFILERRR